MSDEQRSQLLNSSPTPSIMTTNSNNNSNSTLHNLIQYNPLHQFNHQNSANNQYLNSYLNTSNSNELSVISINSLSSSPTHQSTLFSSPSYSPNTFDHTYSMQNSTHPTYSNNSSNNWIKMSECDEFIGPKRSKHTMITHGNFLYVFGGDNGYDFYLPLCILYLNI
jgi:hypothetical protein